MAIAIGALKAEGSDAACLASRQPAMANARPMTAIESRRRMLNQERYGHVGGAARICMACNRDHSLMCQLSICTTPNWHSAS